MVYTAMMLKAVLLRKRKVLCPVFHTVQFCFMQDLHVNLISSSSTSPLLPLFHLQESACFLLHQA